MWAVLLVTIALNLFGAPFMLMVPVIARDVLGATSTQYGILAAAMGIGALTGSIVIATTDPKRQGSLFAFGAAFMCLGVVFFSFSDSYVLSFIALLGVGVAMSGFATMQVALVLRATTDRIRGRAMGAVSLAIGTAPFGILVVGQLAEYVGPQTALAWSAGIGFVLIILLWLRYPELRDRDRGRLP